MKTKLTMALIGTAEIGKPLISGGEAIREREIIFDIDRQSPPGFGVRIEKRSKVYVIQVKIHGKAIRKIIGTFPAMTLPDARAKAAEAKAETRGLTPAMIVGRDSTVRQVLEDYLGTKVNHRASTQEDYRGTFRRYIGNAERFPSINWLDKPLASITRAEFQRAYNLVGAETASQAVKLRTYFYALCQDAIERLGIIDANPAVMAASNRYKIEPAERSVPEEYLPAVYKGLRTLGGGGADPFGETVRDYVLFVLLTGVRKSEGAKLLWQDVDPVFKTFTVLKEISKNKLPHTLPICRTVGEILDRRKAAGTSKYVFPSSAGAGPLGDPRKQLVKAILHSEKLLFPDAPPAPMAGGFFIKEKEPKTFYTAQGLRKTFAECARKTVGNEMTSYFLNHISEIPGARVTATHYSGARKEKAEELRKPLQKVEDRMMKLLTKG